MVIASLFPENQKKSYVRGNRLPMAATISLKAIPLPGGGCPHAEEKHGLQRHWVRSTETL